uniref:Copia protein n=1 Tax=Cajanus cajan TaxID=3821 RepID=A0A151U4I4_CAJCA|nr:Copia protein [Cajanus cajan]
MDFKLYQMDVKSVFLIAFFQEEVYVHQPPSFNDCEFPNHVFNLKKTFYGLKQAPRSWFEISSKFLLDNNYERGKVDNTLFVKRVGNDTILVQIYVNDIVFGATNSFLCQEFVKTMQGEFEMSMMRKLTFFLGVKNKSTKVGFS